MFWFEKKKTEFQFRSLILGPVKGMRMLMTELINGMMDFSCLNKLTYKNEACHVNTCVYCL